MVDELNTFFYVEGRWSKEEARDYSINVLELATENIGVFLLKQAVEAAGVPITHAEVFTDNTTAEHISERGRTQSAGLNELNLRRQAELVRLGIHQRTSRVTSIDNDIADLLSRGAIDQALVIPFTCGLRIARVPVESNGRFRSLHGVPATWSA